MAVTAWGKCQVVGTWNNHAGAMKAGGYTITIPVRVTDAADNVIVPKGVQASGTLATSPGAPSLDVQVLSNTDPDVFPNDGSWKVEIVVTFNDGSDSEKYVIDTPVGGVVNLRQVVLVETFPAQTASLVRGIAGGVAALDADGDVIDADGVKVITSGVGGTPSDGSVTSAKLADGAVATAKIADGAVTATKTTGLVPSTRTVNGKALSANVTLTKGDVALGNVDNTADIDKPVSTAAQAALDAKVPTTFLAGVVPVIYATSLTVWPTRAAALTALGIGTYVGPVEWSGERVGMTRANWVEPAGSADNDYRTFKDA